MHRTSNHLHLWDRVTRRLQCNAWNGVKTLEMTRRLQRLALVQRAPQRGTLLASARQSAVSTQCQLIFLVFKRRSISAFPVYYKARHEGYPRWLQPTHVVDTTRNWVLSMAGEALEISLNGRCMLSRTERGTISDRVARWHPRLRAKSHLGGIRSSKLEAYRRKDGKTMDDCPKQSIDVNVLNYRLLDTLQERIRPSQFSEHCHVKLPCWDSSASK